MKKVKIPASHLGLIFNEGLNINQKELYLFLSNFTVEVDPTKTKNKDILEFIEESVNRQNGKKTEIYPFKDVFGC